MLLHMTKIDEESTTRDFSSFLVMISSHELAHACCILVVRHKGLQNGYGGVEVAVARLC